MRRYVLSRTERGGRTASCMQALITLSSPANSPLPAEVLK